MTTHNQEFVDLEVGTPTGASLRETMIWHSINWKKAHRNVRRLQARIVKAVKEGKKRKVRALQFILTHSLSGKAVAVKRVTSNSGKSTPGVDKVLFDTPEKKAKAVEDLNHKGYKPLPLKRVAIPKSDGSSRFLGIPSMRDRAMQALHLLALDPLAETLADPNSYGFGKGRSAADAIGQCFCALAKKFSAQWILEADIKACFDRISHAWMLSNIAMDKRIVSKWLKTGYIEKGLWHPTPCGTPQGAIISPVLCNLVLDGLERKLKEKFAPSERIGRRNQVNFVRYADDFIITGRSKQLLEQEVKPMVEAFLSQRGLELSETKTRITHINQGFDFLGQNLRKYDGKLLIQPSNKNVKAMSEKVREVIKLGRAMRAGNMIVELNSIIRGWSNYHRSIVSKQTFNKVDWQINVKLWRWARRRHRGKSAAWVYRKYFCPAAANRRVFTGKYLNRDGETKEVRLYKAQETVIKRHIKIKSEVNAYDPQWEIYFEERLGRKMVGDLEGQTKLLHLWKKQNGRCVICDQELDKGGWQIHHLQWRVNGGGDEMANLVLLHPNCHRQVHCQKLEVSKPRPVKRALAEA
jgi:RNA-directed DNA polymerase